MAARSRATSARQHQIQQDRSKLVSDQIESVFSGMRDGHFVVLRFDPFQRFGHLLFVFHDRMRTALPLLYKFAHHPATEVF